MHTNEDIIEKSVENLTQSRDTSETPLTTILKKVDSKESFLQRNAASYKYKGPENNVAKKYRAMKDEARSLLQSNIEAQEYFKPWADKVN
jgi:spore coat polysaccharide biosynthesis protein SpsF (cytidylyltransferase family)